MLILAAGDFHGDLGWLPEALDRHRPDLFLSPGDWGDPQEVDETTLQAVLERVPVLTVSGNHDDRALLSRFRNRDGKPVLLAQGEARDVAGLIVAGISGIWAKTKLGSRLNAQWETARRRDPFLRFEEWSAGRVLPPYVTDAEVADQTAALAGRAVDILITHGCPIALADRTPQGRRGGQRCFRQAFETLRPRLHLCGHVHRFQRDELPDGRAVLNSGHGAARHAWLIDWQPTGWEARPLVSSD
jgi:Icc-related predicted phosphoesterase